ncbi:MAG TPA: hypothetical protein HA360_05425 [Nanoarchaeota archaeon]|nr:hypothetical protein [Candidatus Woesearchaeota archaeon]HIH14932.1 hypothetical protein [Nanoarchaeota archaeon]HIH58419.1 hypothetical protein [Nanoarchaeota archaeon]HII14488.1 hypothetical protein [Nanoarchaeota archaeon]HIJ05644.1 hypothetical protein [Nanoarchaeota archaeon]
MVVYQDERNLMSLVGAMMPDLPYHNFGHAVDVYLASMRLAKLSSLSPEQTLIVGSAGLLHDAILIPTAKDNEERTAEFARRYLPGIGYSTRQIEQIASLILATKIPTAPKNILQEILCDADLDNLGRDDFLIKNEAVRKELGIPEGEGWYTSSLQFLKNHTYYSTAAVKLRDEGKKKNMAKLGAIIKNFQT